MPSRTKDALTPNQVVAYNLRRARELRRLTQDEAAEVLEPYLGRRLSKASLSAAERSFDDSDRVREFTADELVAFARAFVVPVSYFLMPPDPDTDIGGLSGGDYLNKVLDIDAIRLGQLTAGMDEDEARAVEQKFADRSDKSFADAFVEELKPTAGFLRELADTIEAGPVAGGDPGRLYRWAAQLGMAPKTSDQGEEEE